MTASHKLLRELIAIPSVNNAFLPPKDGRAGELRMAEFVSAVAAAGGLEVEFQEVLPQRPNLLARYTPPGKVRNHLILAPHLDTVGEPNMLPDLFVPSEKKGRLYGRGACDTKGSVAAMLSALLAVANSSDRPKSTAITFAGLVDEENGQAGSRALAARRIKADLAIVGEPTELQVVTAHKGDVWLRLETTGKSAHGARPELGINAVLSMSRLVQLLETTYAGALRKKTHPLLGHGTVNVGTIQGGTQPNIVPARCAIEIDRRTLPGETETTVRKEIRALLDRHDLPCSIASSKGDPCLPLETDFELPMVRQFLETAAQRQPIGVDFFCDAAILAAAGIPSVVFGPGSIAQAHTADEWISLTSLEAATALLTRFIRSLP
jgi:acetylornithine deacetylase/succinyl-diaminopimelate desuccinylase-like protein